MNGKLKLLDFCAAITRSGIAVMEKRSAISTLVRMAARSIKMDMAFVLSAWWLCSLLWKLSEAVEI